MKAVVIGALGQLGMDVSDLFEKNGHQVVRLDIEEVDISNIDSLIPLLTDIKTDILINTAAFHHVEKCEADPYTAFNVNAIGARNLAMLSNDLNFYFIHISTDYVFDGKKQQPYVETDRPVPLNVYANTKLSGELFVESIAKNALVFRSSGLYGINPCRAKGGMNFAQLMLKLAGEGKTIRVVDNEILTPTYTVEIARQILKLSKNQLTGICHGTAEGACSWYEFARTIFEIKGIKADLHIAAPGEFPMKVARPTYSVLENKLLKDNGINIFKHWKEGLNEYLGQF
jgi:dTDP-4-dehydrorhamnose reductase